MSSGIKMVLRGRSMICALVIPACGVGLSAAAATVYFEARDGYASESSNWSSGALPTAADTLAMTNIDTNVMRIQAGDNISVAALNICRNFSGSDKNKQIIRQNGGTVTVSSGSGTSIFADWPYDTSTYWLTDGTLSFKSTGNGIHFSGRGVGAFNMDGGNLIVNCAWPRISAWEGRGALDVRGGEVTVTNANVFGIGMKNLAHAILTVGGSGVFRTSSQLAAGYDGADPCSYLNMLPGGRLAFPMFSNRRGSPTYCNLAGGTLAPYAINAPSTDFITNINLVVNSGGARFDTAGRKVHLLSSFQKGNLRKENLYRRWSFTNGSLVDSMANVAGAAHGGVSFADGMASLPGGAHGTAYITLQSGGEILPTNYVDGITFEFWARPDGLRDYQRIFRLFKDSDNHLFLCFNKRADTGSSNNEGYWKVAGVNTQNNNPSSRWTLGEMCHFAVVLQKVSETSWNFIGYRFDARNGIQHEYNSVTKAVAFDPASLNGSGADFSLGYSNDNANDAEATFDEVRIWRRVLTRAELTASAVMGPDADFDVPEGLVKDGEGTLVLHGANDYAGATIVSNGTLSLGTEVRPYHRWSFNGSLEDSEGVYNYQKRQDAKLCGSNASGITLGEHDITLPGGAHESAYVRLVNAFGNGIPTNSTDGITIELWARQNSMMNWARMFNFANNYNYQTWIVYSYNNNINNGHCQVGQEANKANMTALGPWTLGTWFHAAMVAWKDSRDAWKVTFYKHDATTGELLGSTTLTPPEGWSLYSLFLANFDLGRSQSNDPDAAASYDEVRVWGRPFSEQDLARSVRLGPDTLPTFAATADAPATIPATTDLKIEAGAKLHLSGANQTVRTLSGSGTLVGTGRIAATVGIHPGTDGTAGTLTVAGDATLAGTFTVDVLADGTCDKLALTPGGTYDVSCLSLAIKDASAARPNVSYMVFDSAGATLTGAVDVSGVPDSLKVVFADGKITVRKLSGNCVIIR